MANIKGSCLCGQVSYEISGEPMFVGHCACTSCQKTTGSGHSSVAAFADDAVKVHGEVKSYQGLGDSGQPTVLQFCANCGSRLFSRPTVMPGAVIVSLGTMHEGADELVPSMLIYNKRRRDWDHVPEGMATFEGMPAGPG
jgi:hypothetical protein